MGSVDRVVREVLGIWLRAAAPGAWLSGRRAVSAVAAIAGLGSASNAITRRCGGYAILGIDRAPESGE
ncbi:DUF2892 domain-containing protein [Haloferacaceae archaeon DSL9]